VGQRDAEGHAGLSDLAYIWLSLIREGYTKPDMRAMLLAKIKASGKGGAPGQWSARKAQLLVQEYERRGGGYTGEKTESQKSLSRWTKEEWTTKSGKPSTQGKDATGERYLPKKAIAAMSDEEYAKTTAAKRKGTRQGKQFVPQPASIAAKAARYRSE
jgi:protein involved in polysaccharide export with SLBB domain